MDMLYRHACFIMMGCLVLKDLDMNYEKSCYVDCAIRWSKVSMRIFVLGYWWGMWKIAQSFNT